MKQTKELLATRRRGKRIRQDLLHESIFSNYVWWIVAILILATLSVNLWQKENSKNTDEPMTYNDLWNILEDAPENFWDRSYQPHIPEKLMQEIQAALDIEGGILEYESENKESTLWITQNDQKLDGFSIHLNEQGSYFHQSFCDHFAIYRNDTEIIICGTEYTDSRSIAACIINVEDGKLKFWPEQIRNIESIDLFGTKTQFDQAYTFNKNMTLVRIGQNYQFYRYGEAIGKPTEFPGGEIKESNYQYILDDNNDLYYLYYSDQLSNPWIHFVKVDEGVIVEKNSELEERDYYSYVIYQKDGKRYVGVPDYDTFRVYSAYSGDGREKEQNFEIDFTIDRLALVPENVVNATFYQELHNIKGGDWYIHYNYEVGERIVYEKKRVNGLDSYLLYFIPTEKLEEYNDKTVSYEQVPEVVAELKQIYASYE